MSFWGPPLQPAQGNAPPPNPAAQGPPQGAPLPFNALGLGFQQQTGGFAPPLNAANAGVSIVQPAANPFGFANVNNAPASTVTHATALQPTQATDDSDDEDDEEDSDDEDPNNLDPDVAYDESTPIEFRLRVPINVTGNNNVIAIDAAKMARTVSAALTETLRDMSVGSGGVPMIDHNGVARAVNIRVDCKVNVKGDKNTVGEKAVLSLVPQVLRQAMVDGALPISPLSPIEDRHLEDVINQRRLALARELHKKRDRSPTADENVVGSSRDESESSKRHRAQ